MEEQQEQQQTEQPQPRLWNTIPEAETTAMLNYTMLSEMPEEEKPGQLWYRAIAMVEKKDLSVSWCVLRRKTKKTWTVEKVFGRCVPIARFGTIRPFELMPQGFLKKFKSGDKQARIDYIKQYGDGTAQIDEYASLRDLDELAVDIDIKFYTEKREKDERRAKNTIEE